MVYNIYIGMDRITRRKMKEEEKEVNEKIGKMLKKYPKHNRLKNPIPIIFKKAIKGKWFFCEKEKGTGKGISKIIGPVSDYEYYPEDEDDDH